ncbi:MAG: MoxR family ATPase [Chloroflexota bacterium]|nr:MAG: MoxR family ATPase [Chloroflexota bacterium]
MAIATPALLIERAIDNVERVIVGKRHEIELILAAMLSRGHVLIEDVPGVGKTVLARALARTVGGTFKRAQFTPDALPSDVTGVSIYNQKSRQFEFRPGPVMANVVLIDEINRATPKTQSALLEVMEERQVSVDGVTHPVPMPFIVLATQNPVEYEGTFPLPEAQLDRFTMRVSLGYPDRTEELTILERAAHDGEGHPVGNLETVLSIGEVRALQAHARSVYVDGLIREYIVAIVAATRSSPEIRLGASPRGSVALFYACQAWALLRGRDFVTPDDVKALAGVVLGHRLIVSPSAHGRGHAGSRAIAEILDHLAVPGARPRR